jgi:hypothetical protein
MSNFGFTSWKRFQMTYVLQDVIIKSVIDSNLRLEHQQASASTVPFRTSSKYGA